MKTIITFAIVSISLTWMSAAWAVVPDLIPVQGNLTTSSTGAPVDGPNDMRFDIYDARTGGTLLWQSVYNASSEQVDVDQGYFAVYLGELAAYPLDFSSLIGESELWLQLTVSGEAMDRIRMASVAFSEQAELCSQIGEMTAGDIQPSLGAACAEGQYLRGWDTDANAPICETDQTGTPTGTQYYNVSGCEVLFEHNIDQGLRVSNACEVYKTANSSYTNVFAPVHLPDGVTIGSVRAWVLDNNANTSADVYVQLRRRGVAAGTSAATTVALTVMNTSTGSESANIQLLEDTTIDAGYGLIDNENYDYYFIITLGNTASYYASMSFFKAQIAYTHS